MRIISGILKGRAINFVKNSITRPLKDSVRENIFNIIKHSNLIKPSIENSNILDLYSGIGSFGIECISRGANKVTFVEQDLNASIVLKENLNKLLIKSKSEVFNYKIENFLKGHILGKFHILFFDPPFVDLNFVKNIKLVKKKKIFETDHIVIIHRDKKTEENLENFLKIIETKQYGRSKITFGVF